MEKIQNIQAGYLIDGSGDAVRENMLIRMEKGTFREIRPVCASDPPLGNFLDLSDYTLLPALADAHLHLFMSGTADPEIREKQLYADFSEMKTVISDHLEQLMRWGVLAVRDGGDYAAHALRFRDECADPAEIRVCIKAAGKAWREEGRYGRLIGRPPGKNRNLAQAIAQESQTADHVKIVNSGLNSLKHFGKETPPQFRPEDLAAGIRQAHEMGQKVMVHCNGRLPVKAAVEAGCDSVEHGFFMGKENLWRMAERQTFWVPTAITMKAYAQQLPPGSAEAGIAQRNYEHQLKQISLARKLGVPIAVGTDAGSLGVFHGRAVAEEMKILMRAGYSLPQAVQCATSQSMKLMGIPNRGRIVPDSEATFIAVKGKAENITEMQKEMLLFIRGKRVYPASV
ncbi:MAG: amidohydrolase family protein [Desulfococcaceae bacterium]|jgi:imidazolonepropionase-like amidohydrolase|nr:amidohydrolase family protein [Desulfococcaceae bacterium]